MKRLSSALAMLTVLAVTTGCYHATVVTGATPGNQTIEKPWATSLIYGLVPPETVQTASQCPNGIARVETQLSFLNQLVSGLTFGIYTPMTITVTCAAGQENDGEKQLPFVGTPEEAREALKTSGGFLIDLR